MIDGGFPLPGPSSFGRALIVCMWRSPFHLKECQNERGGARNKFLEELIVSERFIQSKLQTCNNNMYNSYRPHKTSSL